MSKKSFQKIYVEITNICNLNCEFCPVDNRKKEYIAVEDFEYILSQIKDYTDLIALHVKGEPLIHPELERILNSCEKFGLKVNITTNGTRINELKEVLVKSKAVRQINVSVHSINENEFFLEDDRDNYLEDVLEASNFILNNSDIIISYRLWNIDSLERNDVNDKIFEHFSKEYDRPNLKEETRQNMFVKLSENCFLNQDFEFKWPDINDDVRGLIGKCWGLKKQIAILVSGDVVPCCLDQNAVISLGNIFDEPLEKILNSELATNIKNGFDNNKLVHPLCQRCEYIQKFEKNMDIDN